MNRKFLEKHRLSCLEPFVNDEGRINFEDRIFGGQFDDNALIFDLGNGKYELDYSGGGTLTKQR